MDPLFELIFRQAQRGERRRVEARDRMAPVLERARVREALDRKVAAWKQMATAIAREGWWRP